MNSQLFATLFLASNIQVCLDKLSLFLRKPINNGREHVKLWQLQLNGSAGETQVFENIALSFFGSKVQLPERNKNKPFSYQNLDTTFLKPLPRPSSDKDSGGHVVWQKQ